MCTITVSFKNNHATIIFTSNSDSSVFAEINMDYSVDVISGYTYINISNAQTSNSAFTKISSLDYIESSSTIRFVFELDGTRNVLDFYLQTST